MQHVGGGDVAKDGARALSFYLGQAHNDGKRYFLGFVHPANLGVHRDLEGVKTIPIQESCP
jgi:hypothetical protein